MFDWALECQHVDRFTIFEGLKVVNKRQTDTQSTVFQHVSQGSVATQLR